MAVSRQQAASEVKHGYVLIIMVVDDQHNMTHLVQLPNFLHPWTATEC